ncbi:hypothetical protein DV453_002583 [Geotrichum candidum]|nr:hypothetical protein DV453_002583 [Geotrichum candidum]
METNLDAGRGEVHVRRLNDPEVTMEPLHSIVTALATVAGYMVERVAVVAVVAAVVVVVAVVAVVVVVVDVVVVVVVVVVAAAVVDAGLDSEDEVRCA